MLIYKAENIQNGNIYIGKTVNSLEERILQHLKSSKYNAYGYFLKAINKHGKDNFQWSILDEQSKTEEELSEQEKFFIALYKANGYKLYNLTNGGDGISGLIRTEEHRIKLSKALIGKLIGSKNPNFGNHLSEESKSKISKSNIGRKHSKESILKMAESRMGFKHTEESKSKISKNNIGKHCGEKHPRFGKKFPELSKRMIGINNLFYGKHHDKETLLKISGENHYNAKLTYKDVINIRMLYNTGLVTQRKLADLYGLGRVGITNIVNYHTWKNI